MVVLVVRKAKANTHTHTHTHIKHPENIEVGAMYAVYVPSKIN